MFDFGIAGYRPAWSDGRSDVVREHGQRLRGPAGRTLTRVWMVWDLELLEWTGRDVAHGNADISFAFESGRVTVFNALDENGVSFDRPGPGRLSHPFR